MANKKQIARQLSKQLKQNTWRPNTIHKVTTINDGITLKKREIVCPSFVNEQVIHHAIMQVLKPIFVKKFYRYSCASVPGRGLEYAMKYIKKACLDDSKNKYYTVIDIKKFFDNIKPSKVFHQLRRMIRDKRTLMLFAYVLRANKIQREDGSILKRGAPIGFYTSPWFANIVLTPLDNLIKQHIKYYVRYNDDMLLFSPNKRKFKQVIQLIKDYLQSIGLEMKNIPQIHRFRKVPITYIGATIRPNKIVLKSKTFLKAKRVANRISKKEKITIYDAQRIVSYAGRFKRYNVRRAFREYINNKVSKKQCRIIISRHNRGNTSKK